MEFAQLLDLYDSCQVTSKMLRDRSARPVLLELCSGTGKLSKAAVDQDFEAGLTVDIDDSNDPELLWLHGDVTDESFRNEVASEIRRQYIAKGSLVYVHASPPCQQYSRANTWGKRDFAFANKIVDACLSLAEQCGAALWTLENPCTGPFTLWQQPSLIQKWQLAPLEVHYCQYGGVYRKATGIAFSSAAAQQAFPVRHCPGSRDCVAGVYRRDTGRWAHLRWDATNTAQRIELPQQLCNQMLSVAGAFLEGRAKQLAGRMEQVVHRTRYRNTGRAQPECSQTQAASATSRRGTEAEQ